MGAYPFILRLFPLLIALWYFPMLYVIKWLYGANRGRDRYITSYGKTGEGFCRTHVRRPLSHQNNFFKEKTVFKNKKNNKKTY